MAIQNRCRLLTKIWPLLLSDQVQEEEIRFLSRGDYFGEQALLKTDFRTANVIANTKTVECLVLDRE